MIYHVVEDEANDEEGRGEANPPTLPLPPVVACAQSQESEDDAHLGNDYST